MLGGQMPHNDHAKCKDNTQTAKYHNSWQAFLLHSQTKLAQSKEHLSSPADVRQCIIFAAPSVRSDWSDSNETDLGAMLEILSILQIFETRS